MSSMKASLLAGVLLTGLGTIAGAQTGRTPLADCTQATSACVDKVDPPDWWVDLPSPMLLLHGTHLRGARIGIRGNGVKLEKTEVSTNGHYAFLWLVTDHAQTQT